MRLHGPLLSLPLLVLSFALAPGAELLPATPTALDFPLMPLESIDHYGAPVVDGAAARLEDGEREAEGLPPRYAISFPVEINPLTRGTWEDLPGGNRVWRLRVSSPGALTLNLGFTRFALPEAARLIVYAAEFTDGTRAYTAADNAAHGELWTPVVLADDIVIELTVPAQAAERVELTLGSVNVGYRGFDEILGEDGRSGACMVDVVCPEGDAWRHEIPAIGLISLGGNTFCSGVMLNNTARDGRPYFLTANHCTVGPGNAASLVVYWNYASPNCGQHDGGSYDANQSGSYYRVGYSPTDVTLLELDELPDPAWGVTYAGWDNTSADAEWAVGISHPSTDEKSISIEYHPTTTTTYFGTTVPGDGTHIRVADWDIGSLEPGSSGSPLFNQSHRVIGQLHGGLMRCTNDLPSWYGRFSVSWTHGLRTYLDPQGTGATTLDMYYATGMIVTPSERLAPVGEPGGPFTPSSRIYTVENVGDTALEFSATGDAAWISLSGNGGILDPGGSAQVTVSLNDAANDLHMGMHHATVLFRNLSTGSGDTQRTVDVQVGQPTLQMVETLDTDPGWSVQGAWAFGQPTGQGGQYGYEDPVSGFTGTSVYGYNLNGDYTNNMPMYSLVTTPIDCSGLSATRVKFHRWLNVQPPPDDWSGVFVSNDGTTWSQLWQSVLSPLENSWQYVEYDISQVADGQATVYLRWTMGPTDATVTSSGWNIDDVEIWGIPRDPTAVDESDSPAPSLMLASVPNPFSGKTEVRYTLPAACGLSLAVFDVAGRRVRTLVEGRQEAGPHSVSWDGSDKAGRTVSSGVYFIRLETADRMVHINKLTLR